MRRILLAVLLFAAVGCRRETRIYEIDAAAARTVDAAATNTVWPGPVTNEIATNYAWTNLTITNWVAKAANPSAAPRYLDFYQDNAWSMSEAKRVYAMFNCVGCHGHGGGGMGPALMDLKWVYGSSPDEIFASITEGRVNGMPAFKDRIPEYMVWQLVAYVRSMSGLAPIDSAPARDDHLRTRLPEHTIGSAQPKIR
jgi:cytochrome c oxidase cbb3-type subunit III